MTEFDELDSPLRGPSDAGGGAHGNAILTRLDFLAPPRAVPHPPALDWNAATVAHKLAAREPRRGGRVALAADLALPRGRGTAGTRTLTVLSAHLEVFCGALPRLRQLASLFDEVKRVDGDAAARGAPPPAVALLADLNTMAHSIVRLSPHYAQGSRWRTLGWTEAAFLEAAVVARARPRLLRRLGADPDDPTLRNPGLVCPFPVDTETLANPAFAWRGGRSLVRGKLDWALLRGLDVLSATTSNDDYGASDHRALVVDVRV